MTSLWGDSPLGCPRPCDWEIVLHIQPIVGLNVLVPVAKINQQLHYVVLQAITKWESQ
jgi:hypothetical protein